jgi:hypothetical protein
MVADDLRRKSAGLSPAHVELIRLLAEVAVQQYFAEVDVADEADRARLDQATCGDDR